jgi:hypothetical protein
MIDKIVSGGQTWPEIAALDLAIKLGIPYTGWHPEIQVPSQDANKDKYRLHTLPSNRPRDSIAKNVEESDGTFILSHGRLQEPADYARQMTLKMRKQLLGIDLEQHTAIKAAGLLASWLDMNHIESLYVTGSTREKTSGIYHRTSHILESAFAILLAQSSLPSYKGTSSGHVGVGEPGKQPATVAEALTMLSSRLSLKEKTHLASGSLDIFLQADHPLGPYIQKILNLKAGNDMLMKSCTAVAGKKALTPDEASHVIIREFWKHLQKTHRLRIIK